tara:strand:- start:5157 stop:6095 length:939 start_codon:yes stop_codon:yes gene_type:complete
MLLLAKKIKNIFSSKILLFFAIFLFTITIFVIEIIANHRYVSKNLTKSIQTSEKKVGEMLKSSQQALMDIIADVESKPFNHRKLEQTIQRARGIRFQFNKIPWTEFSWIDSRNNIVVDSKLGVVSSNNTINLSNRDYVQKALKDPYKIQIGAVVIGSTSFKRMIPFGIATQKNGKYSGAIVLGIEIKKMTEIIKETLPKNCTILLLGVGNEFLLSSDEDLSENKLNKTQFLEKLIKLKSSGKTSSKIEFTKLNGYEVAIKLSDKYPFTFVAIYNNSSHDNNFLLKHSVKIKILILIALSIILIILTARFNKY